MSKKRDAIQTKEKFSQIHTNKNTNTMLAQSGVPRAHGNENSKKHTRSGNSSNGGLKFLAQPTSPIAEHCVSHL
jgi:hypothetical protein